MSSTRPISSPGKYISPTAIGFSSPRGEFTFVTHDAPLPVRIASGTTGAPAATPLAGAVEASNVVGPFIPKSDKPIHLQLSGEWQGSVVLERSIDGSATRYRLTAGGMPWARFTGNVNEPVWQENERGASFWLNITLESGELVYRLSQ